MTVQSRPIGAYAFQSLICSLHGSKSGVSSSSSSSSSAAHSLTKWASSRDAATFRPAWTLAHKRVSGNNCRGGPSFNSLHVQISSAVRGSGVTLHSQFEEESVKEQEQAHSMANLGSVEEKIKVLDMEEYLSGDTDKIAKFCEQLREQSHRVGFFYVRNHRVPQELCDSLLKLAQEFFDLPSESKMQLNYQNSPQFRGYMKIGVENTNGVTDFREQIDLGPEEAEDIDIVDGCINRLVYPVYRRLHGPNQWPPEDLLPDFKLKTEEFMDKMETLSMHIMQAIALSLELRKDYFDSTFQHMPHYQMKVARYPPKPEGEGGETLDMFGVGAHSDSGFLSLLLQDDIGGLQAQTNDGEWTVVPPKKGTFVVNLGEMLQLATGGYYLATVHRVQSQTGSASRYSVPFFFNPRLNTDITALNTAGNPGKDSCVDDQHISPSLLKDNTLRKGRTATHDGGNRLIPVFGQNAFKSFARSHPHNVREFHPDLLQSDGKLMLSKLEEITPKPQRLA